MTCFDLESTARQMAMGDELAFRHIFDHYWTKVYGVALAFTKSKIIAEEITQDVFLKIWIERERFDNLQNTEAYLFTIARNHIYNCLRNKVTTIALEEQLFSQLAERSSGCPENQLIFKESQKLIYSVVNELPKQQRKVFYLSRNRGYSHEKIAEELQLSKQTVRAHMKQALRTIRQKLQMNAHLLVFFLNLGDFWVE